MNFVFSNKSIGNEKIFNELKKVFTNPLVFNRKNKVYITEEKFSDACYIDNEKYLGYITGYARDCENKDIKDEYFHHEIVLKKIIEKSGIENITGNFSCFIYDKKKEHLCIHNDIIGAYPLYYNIEDNHVIISSLLNLISKINKNDLDQIGVIESLITWDVDFTFGSRTILKNTKRLLPGETIFIDLKKNNIISKKYDNSLSDRKILSNDVAAQKFEELVSCELDFAILKNDNIVLPLSGGLDSRLVLGLLPNRKNIHCVNYGTKNSYETMIAKKCALIKNATFTAFNSLPFMFPPKKILKKYIFKTESVMINQWIAIFENLNEKNYNKISIIGDVFDLFTYKHGSINTRKKKIFFFVSNLFKNNNSFFTKKADSKNLANWKKTLEDYYFERIKNIELFKKSKNKDFIINEIRSDLNQLFDRVESQDITLMENIYELYSLLTWGRNTMFNQHLLSKIHLRPLHPMASLNLIKLSFKIDLKYKMNHGLFNQVFKSNRLTDLNNIATATIPFIPNNSNFIIKHFVWASRLLIDNLLEKIRMKLKSKKIPRRLLRSFDNAKMYNSSAIQFVQSYFETDYLGYKGYCKNIVLQRSKLKKRPIEPWEIFKLSKLEILIDDILKNKNDRNTDD